MTQNLDFSSIKDTTTTHIAKPGDKVKTIHESVIRHHKVLENGTIVNSFNNNSSVSDENEILSSNQTLLHNKSLCRVLEVDTNNKEALISMKLPKGEIERLFDLDTLIRLNLSEKGKEFYFIAKNTKTGMTYDFEPYYPPYDPEIEDALDNLEKHVNNA